MQTILDQAVFAVGREQYRWGDVVLASMLWGDWNALEMEAGHGLACQKHADATGRGPDPDLVDAAAKAFRYERDLIAAQEAEAWLDRWGLTPASWMAWMRRSVLRRELAPQLPALAARYAVTQREVDEIVLVDGACAGYLIRFAQKLAEHAAGAAAEAPASSAEVPEPSGVSLPDTDDAGGGPGGGAPGPADALARALAAVARRDIAGLPAEGRRERVAAILRLDDAYARFRARALSPRAIRDQIATHQLDWIRVDCRSLAFQSDGVAREAALCLRDDGEEPARVAAAAGASLRDVSLYLDDLDATLRQRFLSARRGELVGPLRTDGEFVLYVVGEKGVPSEQDPAVRRRAEEGALRRAVAHEVDRRVRWLSSAYAPA